MEEACTVYFMTFDASFCVLFFISLSSFNIISLTRESPYDFEPEIKVPQFSINAVVFLFIPTTGSHYDSQAKIFDSKETEF